MEIIKLKLDENESSFKIENNPEDPYLSFSYSSSGYNSNSSDPLLIATIHFKFHYTNGKITEQSIIYSNKPEANTNGGINSILPISDPNIELVEIELSKDSTLKDFHISLEIQKGRDQVDIQNPIKSFYEFIQTRANSKILFSGGFGQGKTTFLNFYFNEAYQNSYNVFRIFPVNYSVASNEDIFKYVKADILFQLLGYDIDFDRSSIDIMQTFQEYVYLNPRKTIFSFLRNVSKINARTEILDKSLKALNEFMEPIIKYHKTQQVDDSTSAESYIESIYEREGSLFEDNFYSQLIRQLLERIKLSNNKTNVLIVEDLDRMDPDHIFRILNVISAHYDTYKYNGSNESHNKFGFDKIILVCDIENIRSIFHHRYGVNTDFEGYINKYYSTRPYFFKNINSIKTYVDKVIESIDHQHYKDLRMSAYSTLLKLLLEGEELSLREMLKLLTNDFKNFKVTNMTSAPFENGQFYKPLRFLQTLYTSRELSLKFKRLKSKNFKSKVDFEKHSINLLASIGSWSITGKSITTNYMGHTYEIECELHSFHDTIMNASIKQAPYALISGNTRINHFSKNQFCDLIEEHINLLP